MHIDRSSGPSRPPLLKYSRRLRAGGIAAGATLAASSASAAVVATEVGAEMGFTETYSFDPAGSTFVAGEDPAFDAVFMTFSCSSSALFGGGLSNMNWASDGQLIAFAEGEVIDNTSSFLSMDTNNNASTTVVPEAGETVYFGYRIDEQGPGGNESYYGYTRITGHETALVTFDRFAFNDTSDGGITAGAIPEPATTALGFGIFVLACMLGKRLIRRNKAD